MESSALAAAFEPAPSQFATLQRVAKQPNLKDGEKAEEVVLHLEKGDTTAVGGSPSVKPPGWQEIKNLGLTKGKDNWHSWVRFHLLNEDQGGPDDVRNLPVTTQKANHDKDWLELESELDVAAKDPEKRPLTYYAFARYNPARTVTWTVKRGKNKKVDVQTQSANYPSQIFGRLLVKEKEVKGALITETDGAIPPEELKKIPYAVARDDAGKIIWGTKG
jgi:hypothetical protein